MTAMMPTASHWRAVFRVVLAELSERLSHALKDEAELNKALSHLLHRKEEAQT